MRLPRLALFPLVLVTGLLLLSGGVLSAGAPPPHQWVTHLRLVPGPYRGYDIMTCWPGSSPDAPGQHWSILDENNADTPPLDWVSTEDVYDTWVKDLYLANVDGAWENVPGRQYRRYFTLWGHYAGPSGKGDFSVEVWRLNVPVSTLLGCTSNSDTLSSYATLIETWSGLFTPGGSWAEAGLSPRQGAGSNPTSNYGTVLRLAGRNYNTVAQFHIDEFTVRYQHWE